MKNWLKDWKDILIMYWYDLIGKCTRCEHRTMTYFYYDKATKYLDRAYCSNCDEIPSERFQKEQKYE